MCATNPLVSGTVASHSDPMATENRITDIGVIGNMIKRAAIIVRPV